MVEITDAEKAQARRDAGLFDFDEYHETEPASALEEDPVALLKQRYQAGEIDDDLLELAIKKIALERVGPDSPSRRLDWEKLIDSIAVGLKAGIRDYIKSSS